MTLPKEDRQSLKSELVRKAFAATAKAIIIQDGVEAVSARKVAERTGYTYATIYNHFQSMDELLWVTRALLIQDVMAHMEMNAPIKAASTTDVRALFTAYADYFIGNPQVFRFFYFHRLNPEDKPAGGADDASALEKQTREAFAFLHRSGNFSPEEVPRMIKILITGIHGLLTLALSENDALHLTDVPREIDDMIRYLFREKPSR